MFDDLLGNFPIKNALTRMLETKAIANSLLFAGPEGIGKGLFALKVAENLLGRPNHPDLHILQPEGKVGLHSIQALRRLSEEVYMAPFQGEWKVFIIHDAERMLPASSNALLKTFEEPAKDALIILLSSKPTALLSTVLSRCRKIYFSPLDEGEITTYLQSKHGLGLDEARRFAYLAQGSLGKALRLIQGSSDKGRTLLLQQLAQGKIRNYKALSELIEVLEAEVEHSKQVLEEEIGALTETEGLTAPQKEMLQKELDGALTMRLMHEGENLFQTCIEWFRDMQLISVNGNRTLLIHRDYENELEQAFHRGEIQPLEKVEKAVGFARLALERSSGFSFAMESLLLNIL